MSALHADVHRAGAAANPWAGHGTAATAADSPGAVAANAAPAPARRWRIAAGGVGVDVQNAWQAAFGMYSADEDLKEGSNFERTREPAEKPGFGVLAFFFLLTFVPAFLLCIAALVLMLFGKSMPPFFKSLEPW